MRFFKQDHRHTAHALFPYAVNFLSTSKDRVLFLQVREWCWTTWGPGMELFLYSNQPVYDPDQSWCWISETSGSHMRLRILFKDEQQFIYAKLKWS